MSQKVYFFATCLGSAIFTDATVGAIELLRREGIEVIFKKKQTCCGQASYNTGYFEDTKKVALQNMDLFNENYPVIVPSGSCAGMMKHDYVELFKGTEYEKKAKEFSARVYDLSQYLDEVLNVQYEDKGDKVRITWHTNCHALRTQKSIEPSKNLLRRLKNVEMVELQYEEECCGFGGTFAVKEHDISGAIVQQKIQDIENQNVDYVITGDGGCLLNIGGALEKQNSKTKSMHLYEFLLKRLQGERV